jgi:hypothetical protein
VNTGFLLMAQYGAMAIIPLELVCRDYFPHLDEKQLLRKISAGQIRLPVTRLDQASQKGARGVHLSDLADYIDASSAKARKELAQLQG